MSTPVFAVSMVVSVMAAVAMAWVTRPVDAPALAVARRLSLPVGVIACGIGVAASFYLSIYAGLLLVLGNYLLVRGLRLWYDSRAGGITGMGLIVTFALSLALTVTILTHL